MSKKFFTQRVINPVVLIISLIFNVVAMVRIKLRQQDIAPILVHDADHSGGGEEGVGGAWYRVHHVRYNKALFTNAATPLVCVFLLVGIWITAKTAMQFPIGDKNHKLPFLGQQRTFPLFSDQKDLQVHLFFVRQVFVHLIVTPALFYTFSSNARKYLKRAFGFE